MHPADVIIIGAGLTGLTAAHALQRAGRQPVVIDAAPHPGGAVRTFTQDGWLAEEGPNTLQIDDPLFDELFRELGLAGDLLEANPEAQKRYLMRNGQVVAAPSSARTALTTPLFSLAAKLRVPFELLVPRRREPGDESVADFVSRRLGPEFLDYAIAPLVSGIHAGDPALLSIRHAFPKVYALEAEHGGLLRGAVAKMRAAKAAKAAGHPLPKRRLVSFRHGLGQVVNALADRLGPALHLRSPVTSLTGPQPGQWLVGTAQGQYSTSHLVLAVPAWALASLPLPPALRTALAPLGGIVHPPVSVVALGYPRSAVAHPLDGFGCLLPAVEDRQILGTLFSSTLFPGRAPAGQVLLTSFVGGRRHPDRAAGDDATLVQRVEAELQALFGVDPAVRPSFTHLARWPRAIAQYDCGYDRMLQTAADTEAAFPGLRLAGHWRGGIAASACLRHGLELGRQLAQGA